MINTVGFRQDSNNISVQKMPIAFDDNKFQQLNHLANLTNEELKDIATLQVKKEKDEKFHKRLLLIFLLPILGGMLKTTFTKGKLSTKLLAGLIQGSSFAGIIALFTSYDILFNKIKQKSDTLKNYAQNHPLMTLLANFCGFLLGLSTIQFMGYKFTDFITNKKPDLIKKIKTRSSKFADKLNKSFLNDKIYEPISKFSQNFASKFPTITNLSKLAAAFAIPVLLITIIIKSVNDAKELANKQKINYANLKGQRDSAKTSLEIINSSKKT